MDEKELKWDLILPCNITNYRNLNISKNIFSLWLDKISMKLKSCTLEGFKNQHMVCSKI